jgi:hypothetical protein
LAEQSGKESEQRRAVELAELVAKVKAGDDGSGIRVSRDGRLIEMLAGDPECVENLTSLRFDMANLSGPEVASAGKLVNVEKITFYSCYGAENVLSAMKGSAALEELGFDTTGLSDDGIQLLASFPNLRRVYFAYIHEPSMAKLLRETLPGVDVEIDEVGEGSKP